MMTAQTILHRSTGIGLTLEARGDDLVVSPRCLIPADLAFQMKLNKTALLEAVRQQSDNQGWQSIPPDNLPLVATMPNPTSVEREQMIAYLLRQGCDQPTPLTAWLVKRENAYYEGLGRRWDCGLIFYAAARDAVCWQLNMSEVKALDHVEQTSQGVGIKDGSPPR